MVVRNFSAFREIPVAVDPERLLRAARLLQPYREKPFELTLDEDGVAWRDRKGIRFHVHSADGRTELRVHASRLTLFRRGRWRRWVGAAADRLEDLIRLVAEEE